MPTKTIMTRQEINRKVMEGEMDTAYAEYIMGNAPADTMCCNGDQLLELMESGFMMEEFVDHLCVAAGC